MSLTSKLLAILTACILLLSSVPNFLASAWMAIGDAAIQGMADGQTATAVQIEEAIEAEQAALSFSPRAKAYAGLAYLYTRKEQTAENYQLAINAIEDSLKAEPLSAYRWLTLSGILAAFPDRRDAAVEAWRTSRTLSRFDHLLLHQRIKVGIELFTDLSLEERAALIEDVEWAYKMNRGLFRQFLRQNNILEWAKFLLNDQKKTAFLSR